MSLDLSLSDLRVTGPSGRVLLEVPALSLPKGSLVGVKGPSGAGKSTFLYALAGLLGAQGQVRWGTTDTLALTPEARTAFRAEHIGMIFQDFLLFEELGAQSNASLTAMFRPRRDRGALRTRAAQGLAHLGLSDTSRAVASFSGGERQRVGIARALAGDAAVILADEPTASLHRDAADRLIDDLTALARDGGKTLIAVSHDLHLLARMDRVLTIEDGHLTEDSHAA